MRDGLSNLTIAPGHRAGGKLVCLLSGHAIGFPAGWLLMLWKLCSIAAGVVVRASANAGRPIDTSQGWWKHRANPRTHGAYDAQGGGCLGSSACAARALRHGSSASGPKILLRRRYR